MANLFGLVGPPPPWAYLFEEVRSLTRLESAGDAWSRLGSSDFWSEALSVGLAAAREEEREVREARITREATAELKPRPVTFLFDPSPPIRWLRLVLPSAGPLLFLVPLHLFL